MPTPVLWYTWVFGKDDYHAEAMAMMLSCLVHKSSRSQLRIYTDKPQQYRWLAPHVEIEELSAKQVKTWCLDSDYLPRAKAKLIEKVSAEFLGHTVWLDTDMWAMQSLSPLEVILDEQKQPLMYFDESVIARGSHGTDVHFRKYFKKRMPERLPTLHQYNSGVLGLPLGWSDHVTQAITILDDMEQEGVRDWTREQMAMSVPLSLTGEPYLAETFFRHYCGGKQRAAWQPLLKKVLFQMIINRHQPKDIVEWIRLLPASEIPPAAHRRLGWMAKRVRSIRKRLGLPYI